MGAPGGLINRRPFKQTFFKLSQPRTSLANFLWAHAQTANTFRRNSFACGKSEVHQHLFSHSSSEVLQPLTGWRPGKPPGWSSPGSALIHAFSFTNFYVMKMAIDTACQVTQATTTTAYVGSFNPPTSIRFQMKSFPAQTQ